MHDIWDAIGYHFVGNQHEYIFGYKTNEFSGMRYRGGPISIDDGMILRAHIEVIRNGI